MIRLNFCAQCALFVIDRRFMYGRANLHLFSLLRYDLKRLRACLPTFHGLGHLALNIRATGPLTSTWNFPIETVIRDMGLSLSTGDPNTFLLNLLLWIERIKLVPYCLPDVGVGRGGVAGMGLDPIGDEIVALLEAPGSNSLVSDESGRLRLVKVFAMFKLAIDAHYKAMDRQVPGNAFDPTRHQHMSRRRRMVARREYEKQEIYTLRELVTPYMARRVKQTQDGRSDTCDNGTGPVHPPSHGEPANLRQPAAHAGSTRTETNPSRDRESLSSNLEDTYVVPHVDIDLELLNLLDFEGDEFMLDGERRPFAVFLEPDGTEDRHQQGRAHTETEDKRREGGRVNKQSSHNSNSRTTSTTSNTTDRTREFEGLQTDDHDETSSRTERRKGPAAENSSQSKQHRDKPRHIIDTSDAYMGRAGRIIRLFDPILDEDPTEKRRVFGPEEPTADDPEASGNNSPFLSVKEQELLIDYLIQISKLPLQILRLPKEDQFQALLEGISLSGDKDHTLGIEPIKWRAVKLSRIGTGRRGVYGRGWKDAHATVKIVGTYRTRKNRERSAARIQYLAHPIALPSRSPDKGLFGEVKFFISLENPRHIYEPANDLEREEIDLSAEPKELIVALVEQIDVEYTSDMILLRTLYKKLRRGDGSFTTSGKYRVVDVRCLFGLIGLLECDGRQYLTWEDNCWSDVGQRVAL